MYCGGEKFIFILDEWDYIYHQNFATTADRENFTKFLSNLLKDKAYVEMAYMTGILPIAKYSSGSELNMFCEYTMATEEKFSEYFGFTDNEVDDLYDRYLKMDIPEHHVKREGLRDWYDGYHTKTGERVYNPRSVVLALQNNNLGDYWTSSGPYDELFYYISANVDSVRDDVGLLLSDIDVYKRQRYGRLFGRRLSGWKRDGSRTCKSGPAGRRDGDGGQRGNRNIFAKEGGRWRPE